MFLVVRIVVAIALAFVVGWVGFRLLRAMGGAARPGDHDAEPEDVADLAVFLVCRECGTEFQVTRIAELQIPRHCGEKMDVVQRPVGSAGASGN